MNKLVSTLREVYESNRHDWTRRSRRRRAIREKGSDFFARLPEMVFSEARCVFVLSTGRCGTLMLTNVLEQGQPLDAHHDPAPALTYLSRLAYQEGPANPEAYRTGTKMARYELVADSYLTDQIYVETNRNVTFFAPYLAEVFKGSRFIHLVRDPVAFVRSGYRRGYYVDPRATMGHIEPRSGEKDLDWGKMSAYERIAWNWNETNAFIENFRTGIAEERFMRIRSEDLFEGAGAARAALSFCGATTISESGLRKALATQLNANPAPRRPIDWPSDLREQIARYATLAPHYGYGS